MALLWRRAGGGSRGAPHPLACRPSPSTLCGEGDRGGEVVWRRPLARWPSVLQNVSVTTVPNGDYRQMTTAIRRILSWLQPADAESSHDADGRADRAHHGVRLGRGIGDVRHHRKPDRRSALPHGDAAERRQSARGGRMGRRRRSQRRALRPRDRRLGSDRRPEPGPVPSRRDAACRTARCSSCAVTLATASSPAPSYTTPAPASGPRSADCPPLGTLSRRRCLTTAGCSWREAGSAALSPTPSYTTRSGRWTVTDSLKARPELPHGHSAPERQGARRGRVGWQLPDRRRAVRPHDRSLDRHRQPDSRSELSYGHSAPERQGARGGRVERGVYLSSAALYDPRPGSGPRRAA